MRAGVGRDVVLMGMALLLASACPRASANTGGSSAPVSLTTTPAPADAGTTLCRGRPRCDVKAPRTSRHGIRVVEVLLHSPPDAGTEDCNPREYWRLVGDAPPRLLAVDCDEQRSPDEAAAAKTHIESDSFVVDYLEFQASDYCERYQARVDLKKLAVTSEARWEGTSDPRGCHPKRRLTKLAPHGDGTADRPILRLHTD